MTVFSTTLTTPITSHANQNGDVKDLDLPTCLCYLSPEVAKLQLEQIIDREVQAMIEQHRCERPFIEVPGACDNGC